MKRIYSGLFVSFLMVLFMICCPESSAANYTDSYSIGFREAVDVLSELKILQGYPDGSFKPGSILSRGAAAKIISCLRLTDAAHQYPDHQTYFGDVPIRGVFTRYINYCSENSIISGYSDGTFRPADSLSAGAFLKMLLCALGHNQALEGYTGYDWQSNVMRDAQESGLLAGIRTSLDGSMPVSRELAAQLAFNTLQADMVVSTSDGVTPRTTNSSRTVFTNINDMTAGEYQIVQFAEEYFDDLVKTCLDNAIVWKKGRQQIDNYDPPGNRFTVTFDANEGTVGQSFKTVYNHDIYRTLPVPVRNGAEFLGWFDRSGRQILPGTSVSLTGSQTLTAQWRVIEPLLEPEFTIRFNLNGAGTNTPASRTIRQGSQYGALPDMGTVENRRFSGWYTAREGGTRITASSIFSGTSDQTLYAHWTVVETEGEYRTITFYYNDDTSNSEIGHVYVGQPYGNLPDPERAGYRFDGWYPSRTGGDVIRPENIVNEQDSSSLYARWTRRYTVTLDANTYTVSPSTVSVYEGEPFGTLPNPSGDISGFLGWYTADGRKITASTVVSLTGNITLYARWETAASLDDFRYRFKNSAGPDGFNYPGDYCIPQKIYTYMFGADNTRGKTLYLNERPHGWPGNCYGMAATAILFFYDHVSVSGFLPGAVRPYDLQTDNFNALLHLSLTEFIEAVQISQYNIHFIEEYWENKDSLNALHDTVSDFTQGDGEPVVICIYRQSGDAWTGHALLGYQTQDNGNESRLYVYDCNTPEADPEQCYISLNKNGSRAYNAWSYHGVNGTIYSSENNGYLTFIPYDTIFSIWEHRGQADTLNMGVMYTSSSDTDIYDDDGYFVASFRNGMMTTSRDDMEIYPAPNMMFGDDGSIAPADSVVVWLPADKNYRIENDEGQDLYTMSFANVEMGVTLKNTVSSSALIGANDSRATLSLDVEEQGRDAVIDISTIKAIENDVIDQLEESALPTVPDTWEGTFDDIPHLPWVTSSASSDKGTFASAGNPVSGGFSLQLNGNTISISGNAGSITINGTEITG